MISKKYKYKVNNFLYLALKENFKKKINFNWDKYSQRFDIINKIIKKKGFKNYLEIGCFEDENFKKIIIDRKVGVDPISGGTIRLTSDEYFSSNKEIFDIIDSEMPSNLREDYLKILNDVPVPKIRKEKIFEAIRGIIKDA